MLQNYNDLPLKCVKGDTMQFNFRVKNIGEDEEFDEIIFSVKNNYEDAEPIVESSLTNQKIERVGYDATNKIATYYVRGDASETEQLEANRCAYYDIRVTFAGAITTLLRGRLNVMPFVSDIGGE